MKALLTLLLLSFLASCSILDGLNLFAGPGPADGECDEDSPYCESSDYTDVCDTYGAVINDGNESARTFSCVAASDVDPGPCSDSWDLLTPNARDDARILAGSWEREPTPDGIVGRCFPGTIDFMTEDSDLHEEAHDLVDVTLAVEFGSAVPSPDAVISAPITEDFDINNLTNGARVPTLELSFCIPDPTSVREPVAVSAMLVFSDGRTTERRCLERL